MLHQISAYGKAGQREEQIMQLSGTDKAFIKEVIPKLPEPKPHYNSEPPL
jgi:hypothetical protein